MTAAVFACSGRALDAGGQNQALGGDGGPVCTTYQRAYNGQCRDLCVTSSNCSGGTHCVQVDEQNLCLDGESASKCAFLESDTQCFGVGGHYEHSSRGGFETWIPYQSTPYNADFELSTPYFDPYFDTSVPYPVGNEYQTVGCVGNARWTSLSFAADPACSARHPVVRCRRLGNRCVLAPGTTPETPSP